MGRVLVPFHALPYLEDSYFRRFFPALRGLPGFAEVPGFLRKARSAVDKTRAAIASKDTTQLKEQVDQLARTQRMFKGVVSRG